MPLLLYVQLSKRKIIKGETDGCRKDDKDRIGKLTVCVCVIGPQQNFYSCRYHLQKLSQVRNLKDIESKSCKF